MKWPSLWSANSSPSGTSRDQNDTAPSSPDASLQGHDAHDISPSPSSTTQKSKRWQTYLPTSLSPSESNSNLFLTPSNILPVILLTTGCLASFAFYRSYLRRIPVAGNISPGFFRNRSLIGRVTSVGDGDNFRLFHTPGGRLAGWGWLPWRKVPEGKKELKDKTIHVRLAGVDAPELPHFGRPAQPYSQEALDWLTKYLLGRRVRAYVYKRDQYDRVVATAYVWRGLLRRDVGLQMLRTGLATVYEAKTGAEFGEGLEEKYRTAEKKAKKARRGMWAAKSKDFESPREYKTKYGTSEKW